MNSQKNYNFI